MTFTPLTFTPPMSDYAALVGQGGVVRDALAAVPGYAEAADRLDNARSRLNAYFASLPTADPIDPARPLADMLRDGSDLPASLPADLWALREGNAERYAHLEGAARRALAILSGERDRALHAGRDLLMARLNAAVSECVTAARQVDIAGARDAEEAIREGVADAWQRLGELRQTYGRIRAAQRTAARLLYGDESLVDTFGVVRNLAALCPEWFDITRGRHTVIANGQVDEVRDGGRWPWDYDGDSADGDIARFAWLVATPEAQAWVPTPAEADEARSAALAELSKRRPSPHTDMSQKVDNALRRARSAAPLESAGVGAHDGAVDEPWP